MLCERQHVVLLITQLIDLPYSLHGDPMDLTDVDKHVTGWIHLTLTHTASHVKVLNCTFCMVDTLTAACKGFACKWNPVGRKQIKSSELNNRIGCLSLPFSDLLPPLARQQCLSVSSKMHVTATKIIFI